MIHCRRLLQRAQVGPGSSPPRPNAPAVRNWAAVQAGAVFLGVSTLYPGSCLIRKAVFSIATNIPTTGRESALGDSLVNPFVGAMSRNTIGSPIHLRGRLGPDARAAIPALKQAAQDHELCDQAEEPL